MTERLAAATAEMALVREQLDTSLQQREEAEQRHNAEVTQKEADVLSRLDARDRTIADLTRKVAQDTETAIRLESELDGLKAEILKLTEIAEGSTNEVAALKTEIATWQALDETRQHDIAEIRQCHADEIAALAADQIAKLDARDRRLADLTQENGNLAKCVALFEVTASERQADIIVLTDRAEASLRQLSDLQAAQDSMAAQLEKAEKARIAAARDSAKATEKVKTVREEAVRQLADRDKALAAARQEADAATKKHAALRATVERQKADLASLTAQLEGKAIDGPADAPATTPAPRVEKPSPGPIRSGQALAAPSKPKARGFFGIGRR